MIYLVIPVSFFFTDLALVFLTFYRRWNMEAKEELPEYMKPIYIAMLEFGNDLADNIFKNTGLNTLPYIKNEVIIQHPV